MIVAQRENQPHRVLTPLRGTQSSGRAPSPPSTFPGQRFPSRDRLESRRESPGPASTWRSPPQLLSQRGSLESTRSPRPLLGTNSEGQLGVRAQIPTLEHSWSTAGFNRHTRGTGTAGMMLTPGMRAPGPASQSRLSLSSHPSLSSFPSISLPPSQGCLFPRSPPRFRLAGISRRLPEPRGSRECRAAAAALIADLSFSLSALPAASRAPSVISGPRLNPPRPSPASLPAARTQRRGAKTPPDSRIQEFQPLFHPPGFASHRRSGVWLGREI